MSSEIFDDWNLSSARFLHTNVRGTDYEPIDVEAAASIAKDELGIKSSEKKGFAIPLFASDRPVPTNEYIVYRPENGSIGWYDSGFGINGSERFTDCERLNDTEIGHRLRFWLDEYRDIELDVDESELPAERVNPTDRLSSDDRSAFFDELKEFVRSEQNAQRDKNWERYEDINLEEAIRRKRVSGPYIHLGSTVEDGEQAYKYQFAQDEDEDDDVDLRDDEGIFPGNRCILDVESDDSNFPIEVEILSVTDPQITILPVRDAVNNLQIVEKILDGGDTEVWLHELLNPVPFERRLDASALNVEVGA
jgi:hypothetical protein